MGAGRPRIQLGIQSKASVDLAPQLIWNDAPEKRL